MPMRQTLESCEVRAQQLLELSTNKKIIFPRLVVTETHTHNLCSLTKHCAKCSRVVCALQPRALLCIAGLHNCSTMKAAAELHDQVNLVLLPALGVAAIAGLAGLVDPWAVTVFLTAYIVADLLWIAVEPTCLPSLPKVIMAHHVVTLVLLSFPLRYPEFGLYTCLDGLAEVNTYFLIARRQYKQWATVCDVLYWATFVPFRIVLYPALLWPFWQSLQSHSPLNKVLCLGAQFLLCLFNLALLHLSVKGVLKRRQRRASSKDLAASDTTEAKRAQHVECNGDVAASGKEEAGATGRSSAVAPAPVQPRRVAAPRSAVGGSVTPEPAAYHTAAAAYVDPPSVTLAPRLVAAS